MNNTVISLAMDHLEKSYRRAVSLKTKKNAIPFALLASVPHEDNGRYAFGQPYCWIQVRREEVELLAS